MTDRLKGLVDAAWLEQHLDDVRVLDVRMDPRTYDQPICDPDEVATIPPTEIGGRVPGAVDVPWGALGVTRDVGGTTVHGMRPSTGDFEDLMRSLGVCQQDRIVVVGRAANVKELAAATRLYWLLKYFGHDEVALLNGGVAQWAVENRRLAARATPARRGDFRARDERRSLVATLADVEVAVHEGEPQLLDTRAPDHYLGLTRMRRLVPEAAKGHLPGAKMFCSQLIADRMGPATVYEPDEIRRAAAVFGVNLDLPSITYCVSGVLCTLAWFALHELFGNPNVSVFDGSIHEWSRNPAHSIVRLRLE